MKQVVEPKSRAADMKRSRQRKRDAGMVEFHAWVTPEKRDQLKTCLNDGKHQPVKPAAIA